MWEPEATTARILNEVRRADLTPFHLHKLAGIIGDGLLAEGIDPRREPSLEQVKQLLTAAMRVTKRHRFSSGPDDAGAVAEEWV